MVLPECEPQYQQVHHYGDHVYANDVVQRNHGRGDPTASGGVYVGLVVVALGVLVLLVVVVVRYRHYGVYLTHEKDQLVEEEGDSRLRNPVVVLDQNSGKRPRQ